LIRTRVARQDVDRAGLAQRLCDRLCDGNVCCIWAWLAWGDPDGARLNGWLGNGVGDRLGDGNMRL